MSDEIMTYAEIVDQIRKLDPTEQAELLQELVEIIKHQSPERGKHSILELQGLGAEIWAGIDAQEYVRQEREAWDGNRDYSDNSSH